ncbi:MAG: universal stress protein [Chloroflexi bacterium]|nr:universal stress protein [Chloroflexota bacterium]
MFLLTSFSTADPAPWKRVLVPVRGDPTDAKALRLACEVTRDPKGKVFVVYVIEVPHHLPLDSDIASESTRAEEVLHQLEALGKEYKGTVEAVVLQARDAGPAVVQEAVERQVDIILMAVPYQMQHGLFTLGSAAPHILRYAPCPVLLWRQEMSPQGYGGEAQERRDKER